MENLARHEEHKECQILFFCNFEFFDSKLEENIEEKNHVHFPFCDVEKILEKVHST